MKYEEIEKKADQYINIAFIDYGDLNEQAEKQIKLAYMTGATLCRVEMIKLIQELERILNDGCSNCHEFREEFRQEINKAKWF